MKANFKNFGPIAWLGFKLSRVQALIWIALLGGMPFLYVPTYNTLFPTAADRLGAAALFDLPATKIFAGPGFGLSTTNSAMNAPDAALHNAAGQVTDILVGPLALGKLYLTILICVAIMSIFFIVRFTRAQEESGLLDLVRAHSVGKHVQVFSALLLTAVLNMVVAVALSLAFIAGGMWVADSIAVGLGCLLCGLLFAAIAAFFAELSERARTARLLGLLVVAAAYLFGAVGNAMSEEGNWLTWLSPFQWAFLTRPFAGLNAAPLALYVAPIVIFLSLALIIGAKRDLGSGLIQARAGRSHASSWLRGPITLVIREQRVIFAAFAVIIALFAVMFAAMSADLESILAQNPIMMQILSSGATSVSDFTAGIYSSSLMFTEFFVAVWAVVALGSLASDENKGLSSYMLTTKLSRTKQLLGRVVYVVVSSAALLAIGGLALGAASGDNAKFSAGDLVLDALQRLPSALLIVGVGSLFFALAARAFPVIWAYLGFGYLDALFGDLLKLPDFADKTLKDISPFGSLSATPLETFHMVPFASLTAASLVFIVAAVAIYRQRDVA